MSIFGQVMTRCDDCNEKARLAWWGRHIMICQPCRKKREDAGSEPQP